MDNIESIKLENEKLVKKLEKMDAIKEENKNLKIFKRKEKIFKRKLEKAEKETIDLSNIEPFVICRRCCKRLRANTLERLTYCNCCKTAVKGNDKYFVVDSKKNDHVIIYQNFKDYILTEKELWSI